MAYRMIWEIEVQHEGLNKYRHIRGYDKYVVEQKAAAQRLAWDEMWERKQAADSKRISREMTIRNKEEKKELAVTRTEEAQQKIDELESILSHTLSVDDTVDWASLMDRKPFPKKKPSRPKKKVVSDEPNASDLKYQPVLGFFDKIFPSLRKKKSDEASALFIKDHFLWLEDVKNTELINKEQELKYLKILSLWEQEKIEYEAMQRSNNDLIAAKRDQYLKKEPDAVSDYCEMVLGNSIYPDYFPQDWDIDFQSETGILIVDYSLPDISQIPTLKSVKYIVARDEFSEATLSVAELNKLYDNLLYQIALRTLHELFEADVVNAIRSICFNGWVESINKATGQNVNACIMSVQAAKEEFIAINLEKVDPKACFKQLKGVGSSKLYGLLPIAPIVNINKEDRRFVSAYSVVDEIEDVDNLAAMDWQDFENLIREIFEKEFVSTGGEVKITQASRDGGVDAIAFDPDPIRGGKIVIQAKRYTNTVGVSAVRDLFGTTVNEGATKGILVTTSDYGPDAYAFAKGKPLTLLNGSNLLHLLEKHGHKAKIDIREAKKILSEQK